eukprot:4976978-Pyramimonas_sp.AAC.1
MAIRGSIPKHYAFARYGHTPFIGSSTGLCIVAWEGTPSRTRKKWRGDMRSFTRVLPAKCHISGHVSHKMSTYFLTDATLMWFPHGCILESISSFLPSWCRLPSKPHGFLAL